MVNKRKFAISGGLFSGFETQIDLESTESKDDIIAKLYHTLENKFEKMTFLIRNLKKECSHYHIHDIEFGSILISKPTDIFYICNHCESK